MVKSNSNTKSTIKYKNNKNNKNNIFIIVFIVICFLVLLYMLIKKYYYKYTKTKFINLDDYLNPNSVRKANEEYIRKMKLEICPVYTACPVITCPVITKSIAQQSCERAFPDGRPEMEKEPKQCKETSDIIGFCKNSDICCGSESETTKCFCDHPLTKSCKTKYDTCMKDPSNIKNYKKDKLTEKCNLEKSGCCEAHNKIEINSNNFNKKEHHNQSSNLICSTPPINNIEQKCLELCQSRPDCKAYVTSQLSCDLFSEISPYSPPLDPKTGKPLTNVNLNINFFSKKTL